jgi:hypothetical protein
VLAGGRVTVREVGRRKMKGLTYAPLNLPGGSKGSSVTPQEKVKGVHCD